MVSRSTLGLRRRIWIAVSLITVIPIIILFYYFSGYYISTITTVILGLLIFLGWWVVFEVFWSVIRIANYTRKTFEKLGEQAPPLTNEVKSLESIMESLSVKVKDNLEQLKTFSEKTDELNKEISKKVFILSTVLQANDLFLKETPDEQIINFLMENLKEILEMDVCFCSLKEDTQDEFKTIVCMGTDVGNVEKGIVKVRKQLGKIKKIVRFDRETRVPVFEALLKSLEVQNLAVIPIVPRGRLGGILGVGNNKAGFVFSRDYIEILDLFAKNIALIWEHKKLSIKVKELEIVDYLTGLYNRKFIMRRLDEEIERSIIYQRPCGFMLMEIVDYDRYQDEFGLIEAENLLRKISQIFKDTVRPIDFIGRVASNKIGVILIEKNKRQSQQNVKEIKHKLTDQLGEKVCLAFAIAENPINGATAADLTNFAQGQIDKEFKSHGV
ncbi:MAG: diguanylate cyclase [Candidatus Omnitrophota bacterium]|nr:MAG: diguanylate cyclase [Candidatus Omnitrophota bacterium]